MWRRRSGVLVVFFSFVNGGRDLPQHIKAFRSGKGAHVRRVSYPSSRSFEFEFDEAAGLRVRVFTEFLWKR